MIELGIHLPSIQVQARIGDIQKVFCLRLVAESGTTDFWWAIAATDTWPGMVMDLRRLGFESMASGNEVFVRELQKIEDQDSINTSHLVSLPDNAKIHILSNHSMSSLTDQSENVEEYW